MKKRVLAIAATAMATMMMASPVMAQDFKIGICNYVDDASLNQIVDNIQSRLKEIGEDKDVTFDEREMGMKNLRNGIQENQKRLEWEENEDDFRI